MFVLIRAILYASVFISLVLVYLPTWLLSSSSFEQPAEIGWIQILAMVLTAIGAVIALWSIAAFVKLGKGTPAPFDAPRKLVIKGPYQYVRNPMYIGVGLAVAGAGLYYWSLELLLYLVILTIIVSLFIYFYEEPTLKRMFGAEYEDYCKRVRRWLPGM